MVRRFVLTVDVESDRDDAPRVGDIVQDGTEGLQGYHARVVEVYEVEALA